LTRIIGDVHGRFPEYRTLIEGVQESIQLGDFGIGFEPSPMEISLTHQFIRGNHDNPDMCRKDPHYIKDGTVRDSKSGMVMFIGGAHSIDKDSRIEGQSWWRDEELNTAEFYRMQTTYLNTKPGIMFTHDCPGEVAKQLFGTSQFGDYNSITSQAFNSYFEMFKPKLWIFGHHHIFKNEVILGTRFICLPELAYMDVNL